MQQRTRGALLEPTLGGTVCRTCPSGAYCNTTHQPGFYSICPGGTFNPVAGASSGDACLPCAAGKFTNSTFCRPCAYSVSHILPTECSNCSAGTFAPNNSSTCPACAPASYSAAGAGSCSSVCPAGTYAGATPACLECPAGTQQPTPGATSASACTACAAGFFSAPGSPSCTACAASRVSGVGSAACSATCPAGTGASPPGSACLPCPVGTWALSSATCSPCAAGMFAATPGSAACSPCPVDQYSAAGATACNYTLSTCPEGTTPTPPPPASPAQLVPRRLLAGLAQTALQGRTAMLARVRAPRARKGALPSPLGPLPAEPAIMVLELSAAQLAPPVPRAPAAAWALAV